MSKTPSSAGLVIIAGYGPGLGQALAARFSLTGEHVITLSRSKPTNLHDTVTQHYACDLTNIDETRKIAAEISSVYGAPDILIYNAASLLIAPFEETDGGAFQSIWQTNCLSAYSSASAFLPSMLPNGGTVIFTGATASIRGGAKFSAFASAKFALRGLAQSLAREFAPKGIHVAHVILDGLIYGPQSIKHLILILTFVCSLPILLKLMPRLPLSRGLHGPMNLICGLQAKHFNLPILEACHCG